MCHILFFCNIRLPGFYELDARHISLRPIGNDVGKFSSLGWLLFFKMLMQYKLHTANLETL